MQVSDDSGDNGYETCSSQSQVDISEHRGGEDSKEARHSSPSGVSCTKSAKRRGGASASGNVRCSYERVNGDEEAQLPKTGEEVKDEAREAASTQAMTETCAGIKLLSTIASPPPLFFTSYGNDAENSSKEKSHAKRRRDSAASRDEREGISKGETDTEDDDPVIVDSTAEGGGGTESQMNQDTESLEQEHTVSRDAHAETRSEDEKAVSANQKQEGKSSKYFASSIETIVSGTEKDDEKMTSAHASDAPISRKRQASSSVSSATSPLPQSRATSPVGSSYWKPFATYDPEKKPQVLFMDSLGSHRKKKVITVIETYLQNIFKDRAPKTEGFESDEDDVAALAMTFDNLPSRQLDVTTQPNYYDCGVFVVRYVEEVLRTKYKSCSEDRVTNEEVIDAVKALTRKAFEHVRRDMRQLMKNLHAQYEELLARKAQEQGAEEESTDEVEAEEIKKDDAGPGAEATKKEPWSDDRDAEDSRKDDLEKRGNADPGTISHEEGDAEVFEARNPDNATMQVSTKKKEEEQEGKQEQEQEQEEEEEEEGTMLGNDTKGDIKAQVDTKKKKKMKDESAAVVKSKSDEESAVEAIENKNGSKPKASTRIDDDANVESNKGEDNADVEEISETNNNADAESLKDKNNDDTGMKVEEEHVVTEKVRSMEGAKHDLEGEDPDPILVAKDFAGYRKGKEGFLEKQPTKVEEGDEEEDDLKDEASKTSAKTRLESPNCSRIARNNKKRKGAAQTVSNDVEVIILD